MLQEFE